MTSSVRRDFNQPTTLKQSISRSHLYKGKNSYLVIWKDQQEFLSFWILTNLWIAEGTLHIFKLENVEHFHFQTNWVLIWTFRLNPLSFLSLNVNDQHYQDMLPVLHQVNVSLINDEQFNRRQKVKISLLLSFSTNDGPQAQRGGNEDVRGIEGGVKSDAPLQNRHSYANSQGHVSSLVTTKPSALPCQSAASPCTFHSFPLSM